GVRTVRDPHLVAVDDVTVALLLGPDAHGDDIGTRARLRHGERADMLARNELRQIFALLRLRTPAAELVDAEIGVRAIGKTNARGAAADFLHGNDMLKIAEPGAAELLLHGDAEKPETAEFRPEIAREGVRAVDPGGARRNLVRREGTHRVADHVRRFAKVEV